MPEATQFITHHLLFADTAPSKCFPSAIPALFQLPGQKCFPPLLAPSKRRAATEDGFAAQSARLWLCSM